MKHESSGIWLASSPLSTGEMFAVLTSFEQNSVLLGEAGKASWGWRECGRHGRGTLVTSTQEAETGDRQTGWIQPELRQGDCVSNKNRVAFRAGVSSVVLGILAYKSPVPNKVKCVFLGSRLWGLCL